MIIGGGMANAFLQAMGYNIGASLTENDLVEQAKQLLNDAKLSGISIGLPQDVVVVKTFDPSAIASIINISDVADDDIIIDIGPATAKQYADMIAQAKTIIWNGLLGLLNGQQLKLEQLL